jgi:N-acetylmuramoyl-L-alanine amidase
MTDRLRTYVLSLSLSLLLVPSHPSLAFQQSITIRVDQRPPASARAFSVGAIQYLSVEDFASALGLPLFRADDVGKVEFRVGAHRIKASADNPYLVITEVATNVASVSQLSQRALLRNNAFYVPVVSFVRLVSRLSEAPITYNEASSTIVVGSGIAPPPAGRPAPVVPPPRIAARFDITGLQVEERLNGYLLTVKTTRKLADVEKWLKRPDGWLFLTIPDAKADIAALNATPPFGAVKKVLAFQSPTSVQITIRVAPDVTDADLLEDTESTNLFVSLHTESLSEKLVLERKRQELITQNLDNARSRWKLDVIVIDPGHGGKDPGTIGVSGTREKDVTLAIALQLGQLIENNLKDVKVVYTRKTDRFVELYRRTQIANEAEGKLFISIHCNSTERKPSSANGFEIYLLRPGKTEHALRIAERENAVVKLEEGYEERYKKLTEEEFIILNMAQSAFMKHSERFAEIAAETMSKHLKIKNSGVKQAGFYVLVGASMPNVLVETGYLSNRQEEQLLRSKQGQQRIAEALFEGIKEYKSVYERTLEEGRATSEAR